MAHLSQRLPLTRFPCQPSLLFRIPTAVEASFLMNSPRKLLLIDNASDRKERIKALADRGFTVFPALRMDEARSRCTRGGYDLIVVNAGDTPDQAMEFCDQIHQQCPKQLLLLASDSAISRDYAISGGISSLIQRVDELLREGTKSSDLASAA